MRSICDLGEAVVWRIAEWRDDLTVLVPIQTVAEIPKEKVKFLIKGCFEAGKLNLDYVFSVFTDLGEGEYTYIFKIDAIRGRVSVSAMADFPIFAYSALIGIKLAQRLAATLPDDMIFYGAPHDGEWIQVVWEGATLETLKV